MIPIVISPSQQKQNICSYGDTEAVHCREIGRIIYDILKLDARLLPYIVLPATGSESDILQKVVAESNFFIKANGGEGLHICLHTDAYDKKSSGITTYYYAEGGKGERLAINIHNGLLKLTRSPNRGCTARPTLYELKNTIASAVLVEMGFHDNMIEATRIHANMKQIADSIVTAIYQTLELDRPKKEVAKLDEEWKLNIIKDAFTNGSIKDCEEWMRKMNEPMPVWAVLSVANQLNDKITALMSRIK